MTPDNRDPGRFGSVSQMDIMFRLVGKPLQTGSPGPWKAIRDWDFCLLLPSVL